MLKISITRFEKEYSRQKQSLAKQTLYQNRKVLLRERKRHTARCVSSTPSAVLSRVRGVPHLCMGIPLPGPDGDSPPLNGKVPITGQGTPYGPHWSTILSGPGRGTPHWDLAGAPPEYPHWDLTGAPASHRDLARVPPCQDLAGVSPVWIWSR